MFFPWRNAEAVMLERSVLRFAEVKIFTKRHSYGGCMVKPEKPRNTELLPNRKNGLTKVQQNLMCIPQASISGIYSVCSIRLNINCKMIAGG